MMTQQHEASYCYRQVIDAKRRMDGRDATSQFLCDDADSETWDYTNGGYSPRNDAYRSTQRFVDMWRNLVGTSPQGIFRTRFLFVIDAATAV